MSKFAAIAAAVIVLCIAVYILYPDTIIRQPDGILCPEVPAQKSADNVPPIMMDEFTITPLATFSLHGRVLSRKDYSWGEEANISPVDLALGWKEMSDQKIVDQLDIEQGSRWYRWKPKEAFPVPRRTIEQCSANMHMIPADELVESALDEANEGNIIYLKGYLVKVTKQDGWHWISSLSRDDVGNGACEVIYVQEFAIEM